VFTEGFGLFTQSGPYSAPRQVAELGTLFHSLDPSSINDAGIIAFQASLAEGYAILLEDHGTFTTIADTSGAFESLGAPALNNHGTVAFQSQLYDQRIGIFTGPDPELDRVIGIGDTLFGATVNYVSFFRGLNDAGQIVFWASLSDGRQGVFRANPTTLADLRVSTISAPAKTSAGSTITVKDTTKNQGAGPADTSTTQWSLSTTATAGPGAVVLASRSVPALAAGALSTKATVVTIPGDTVPGKYFLIAAADAGRMVAETDDTNNEKGKVIVIGPDLRVTALAAPSSVTAGANLTITDQTKNAGGAPAGASTVQFYLSKNRKLDTGAAGDVLLGSRAVPELAPGATSPGSTPVTIPTGTAAGTYFIIAIADPDGDVAEAIESNNTKLTAITIAP
jgi:subtilase family serine protease